MLGESHATALLILHAVLATFLVGASTHQLLWCLPYLRGRFAGVERERRSARATAVAFGATFAVGALLYPTYKVRVRATYFDAPSAVRETAQKTQEQASAIGAPPPPQTSLDLSWASRLFDVKEHWVALGAASALLLALLGRRSHPSEFRAGLPLYIGLSFATCATAWTGALIGLCVTAQRAVGGAG